MAVSVVTPTKKKNEYEKGSRAKEYFKTDDYAFLQTQARIYGKTDYDGSEQKDKLLINLDKTSKDNTTGYKAPPGGKGIVQGALSGNSNNYKPNKAGEGAVTPQASSQTPSQSSNNPTNGNPTSPIVADATNFLMQQANALRGGNTRYSKQADTALSRVLNREEFSYDMNADPLFQQALSSAMNNGQMAMRNTMAQASALTGGYGSSYATTAGNQAYNDFIQDAYDNLPQYYNMALQAYQMETNNLLNEYALLSEADNQAYQRALDSYNMAYNMRNRLYDEEYQLGRDEVTDTRYNTEWDYQLGRDEIADERYTNEWNWQKETDQRDYDYQAGRDTINDTRYDTEWTYKLKEDEEDDTLRQEQWTHQQEQDAADNYYRQQAFNHEVEQDKFNNQLNGDSNRDGMLSDDEMAYLSSLNDKGAVDEGEQRIITWEEDGIEHKIDLNKMPKSLQSKYDTAQKEGWSYERFAAELESVPMTPEEEDYAVYLLSMYDNYIGDAQSLSNIDEIDWDNVEIKKIDDTVNGLFGIGNIWGRIDDDIYEINGNSYSVDDIEKALVEEGYPEATIDEILEKINDLDEGKTYTRNKK